MSRGSFTLALEVRRSRRAPRSQPRRFDFWRENFQGFHHSSASDGPPQSSLAPSSPLVNESPLSGRPFDPGPSGSRYRESGPRYCESIGCEDNAEPLLSWIGELFVPGWLAGADGFECSSIPDGLDAPVVSCKHRVINVLPFDIATGSNVQHSMNKCTGPPQACWKLNLADAPQAMTRRNTAPPCSWTVCAGWVPPGIATFGSEEPERKTRESRGTRQGQIVAK